MWKTEPDHGADPDPCLWRDVSKDGRYQITAVCGSANCVFCGIYPAVSCFLSVCLQDSGK